jgi:outer membrane protein
MNLKIWAFGALVMLNLGALVWILSNQPPKTGFIDAKQLFDGFDGKKELQKKFEAEVSHKKQVLDSLRLSIQTLEQASNPDKDLLQKLLVRYQTLNQQFQETAESQNADYLTSIEKQINEYTKIYAEQKGYDYIWGATGSGSLMYGAADKDITQDLLKFINEKYAGK